MKRTFLYLLLPAAAIWLTGCYKEAPLKPTYMTSVGEKFAFPQGSAAHDDIFKRIFDRFGIKVIYKDFTQSDLNRSWTSPSGGQLISTEFRWNYETDPSHLEQAGRTIEKILGLLPDSVLRTGLRVPYLYLIDGLYPTSSGTKMTLYPGHGLDAKAINLELSAAPNSYCFRVFFPFRLFVDIFMESVYEGRISMPAEWYQGINSESDVTSWNSAQTSGPGTIQYRRFWGRQGNIPFLQYFTGFISIGGGTTQSSRDATGFGNAERMNADPKAKDIAYYLMFTCLDYHWESYFAPGKLLDDCSLTRSRIETFITRMRNVYGVDVDLIRDALYDGTAVDTTAGRIGSGIDDTYIYHN
ncbi:MAG: hypothetical protein LBH06_08745 [Rikenellaceae bacterium]|jgi:hypothetical protein|nr:hypothetical protein [Rikenellaceae bacterium]